MNVVPFTVDGRLSFDHFTWGKWSIMFVCGYGTNKGDLEPTNQDLR